ncbi:hypothetical protein B296_00022327 [Ensete ventricosum]|uniref:Homeobox domain-containing protein n=1 Tax=Ensete ventricosum TaxID=4639 RepID=A0A426Y083_ENSVE|nr:hypothetical protein B296_00022327 [Ensete ventricosum]
MASSNRHWPSMFKSKPCNAHHQWQHDINAYHQRTPYASGDGRLFGSFFSVGRKSSSLYGQVGDANVFYWFQNRKSRSKNKQRHLQGARLQQRPSVSASPSPPPVTTKPAGTAAATSSSSSSSEQTTGSDKTLLPVASMGSALTTTMRPTLPAISMNPMYLHGPGPAEFGSESFLPQGPHGYCFTGTDLMGIVGVPEQAVAAYPGLWGELMGQNQECNTLGDGGPATSTVFTNELAFEVAAGPLNIKETFGHEAVLVDHSGDPVLTDEWGVTIHPLQHGACYYLVSFHSPIHHVKKEVP